MKSDRARDLLAGAALSVPLGSLVLATQVGDEEAMAHVVALLAVLVALPWLVPALVAIAVASAPIYAWLHSRGDPPELMAWLSGVILVAAVIGCHVNGALLFRRLLKRRARAADAGLAEFLRRSNSH